MASLAPLSEYPEAQQEQVNVLESIYGESFQRVQGQKSAWQVRMKTPRFLRAADQPLCLETPQSSI
jgi:hypothetical protein